MTLTTIVGGALVVLGSAISLLGAVGVVRLPDALTRMHAATKPASLGLVLLTAGAVVLAADFAIGAKLALAALIQLWTVATGAQLFGNALVDDSETASE